MQRLQGELTALNANLVAKARGVQEMEANDEALRWELQVPHGRLGSSQGRGRDTGRGGEGVGEGECKGDGEG